MGYSDFAYWQLAVAENPQKRSPLDPIVRPRVAPILLVADVRSMASLAPPFVALLRSSI